MSSITGAAAGTTTPTRPAAGLFTRQASGLVRELGVLAATGIALASVALPDTFINFNAGLTDFSKVEFYLPLLAGAFIWFVAMFAYRYLVEAIPRAGGEYVFLSRIVSPVVGSMAGIGLAVVFTYVLATNAHFFAAYTPFMLTGLGNAFSSHGIANAANHVGSKGAIAAISVGVMLLVAALSFFSLKRVAQIIIGFIVLQLLAFLVLALLLADHSHTDFVNAFANYSNHPGAYQDVISAAKASGVVFGASVGAMIATIPFMVVNYNGVLYSYYVGGELRRPARTYLYASAISIGLLVVVWVGVWALLRHTAGLHFMQAQANLGNSDPTTYGKITTLQSSAGGLGYGLALSGDPISKILLATTIPLAAVAVNIAFLACTTRVLFALAFDRLLPVRVAQVSERNHAPTTAIVIVLIVSILFCLLLAFVNISNIVALEALFFALILLAGGVAATFLAHRRPELITRPGQSDVDRWAGLPVCTWVGGATTALALFTVIEVIAHQNAYGKFSFESVAALVIVLVAGPVIYGIARATRRRQNSLDLSMSMRELPPE
ncbi:MAG TPA: APC family permease [Solirubrobacteraceae bacterium]|nr:APC family permease [Solirubrobacteraceae bacterium]